MVLKLFVRKKRFFSFLAAALFFFQSLPAHGGSTSDILPVSRLTAIWSEAATERDEYQLAATSNTLKNIPDNLPRRVTNIPLDPEQNVLVKSHQDHFFGRYTYLARDTGYLIVPAVIIISLLYMAPESVSNWSKEDKDRSFGDLGEKWWKNVSNGPIWDEDDWWLNWIAHPYWGATYYLHARHYAYNRGESFWYAFFVSNVLYEYGIEAFAEEPSIQDLISTPIGGLLLGEYIFVPLEARIMSNGNTVWGNKVLGKTIRFLLDPIGSIIRPLRCFKQKASGGRSSQESCRAGMSPIVIAPYFGEDLYGLHVRLPIN